MRTFFLHGLQILFHSVLWDLSSQYSNYLLFNLLLYMLFIIMVIIGFGTEFKHFICPTISPHFSGIFLTDTTPVKIIMIRMNIFISNSKDSVKEMRNIIYFSMMIWTIICSSLILIRCDVICNGFINIISCVLSFVVFYN